MNPRLKIRDNSARLFIRVLYNYRTQGKCLHEFVVRPDHFHILLTIDAGMTIERTVQFIKGGFSFRLLAGNLG
jgi:REP-associated tyrosine transposase